VKHKITIIALASTLFMAASGAHADVRVANPWVRGIVKGQTDTGAFMTLKSTEATRLVGASSPAARSAQIHEMKMSGDMMTMRPVTALDVPADTAVELKPGGYHVMLIGMKKPLAKGDKVPIKLTFQSKGGAKSTVEIQAEVRDLTEPNAPAQSDHMHMKH
jgi:copper(I)-binding protein